MKRGKLVVRKATKQTPAREPEPELNHWEVLTKLIQEYADAAIAESWKGGGDPLEVPVYELELELARSKLRVHMERMQRELT